MNKILLSLLCLLLPAIAENAYGQITLSEGPYLQMGNQSAVTIRWRTNTACKSRILLGTTMGTYPIVVNNASSLTDHELRVTGLASNTKYFYQVGTDTSIIQGDANNFFVTAPADTSTRRISVAVFGDCGQNTNNFQTGSLTSYQNYLASQSMQAADLMLLVGDNAYDAGTDAEYSSKFFARYSSNILKNHILFPCPGNHDYANNVTRQADHNVPYYSLFTMPAAAECGGLPSGTEAYYSYDWGNVHFLSLDSYGEENAGTTRLYDTAGAQVTWIKNDLAANTKKWTIVYFHHAPFTKGSHNSDAETELINIRQNFIRILERFGVDLIICGHSHDYERSYLLKNYYGTEASFNKAAHTADSSSARYNGTANSCPYVTKSGHFNHGTVYVVSGSSGADGGVQSGYPHDALPFSVDDGGMFFLDINDNRLDAKFLRRGDTIADRFTIMKDVKVKDTITIAPGASVDIKATWPGAYAWNTGATGRAITIAPPSDTLITVKDSVTHTCITDSHFIDVTCALPAPASITGTRTVCTGGTTLLSDVTPDGVWSSSNNTVATIGSTGAVSGLAGGTATISYTVTNGCGSVSATAIVTVNAIPAPASITGMLLVCNSATTALSDATAGGTWSSSNTSAATVGTTGIVTGVSAGTASIDYTVTNSCGSAFASATVTVNPVPAPITGTKVICGTSTTTLADATTGGTWSSSSSSVATINSSTGVAKGVSAGTATITYTTPGSGCRSTTVVTVRAAVASITGTASVCGTSTTTLADATTGGTWSSSSPSVAAINSTSGVVTGVSAGTSSVSYTTVGSGCRSTITVTVRAAMASITGTATVCGTSTTTLADATSGGKWSSSATSVAAVGSGTGIVTGVSSGTATITYATTGGGCFSTRKVTVNPVPANIAGSSSVAVGANITLTDATTGGTWSSSSARATVGASTGIVHGVSAGTATITYKLGTGCLKTKSVSVTAHRDDDNAAEIMPGSGNAIITLIPNPNRGIFTVNGTLASSGDEEVTLEVTDMLGKSVYKNKITALRGEINEKIQLSNNIANGNYLLRLSAGSESKVFQMVINK